MTIRRAKVKRTTKKRHLAINYGDRSDSKYYNNGFGVAVDDWTKKYAYPYRNADSCLAEYHAKKNLAATTLPIDREQYGIEEISSINGCRDRFNDVLHRKIQTVNYPYLIRYIASNPNNAQCWPYARIMSTRGRAVYLGSLTDRLFKHHSLATDQQFSARAFWSMRPRFEGQVSIINSIFELKDFSDILHLGKIIKNLQRTVASPLYSAYKREFNALARSTNSRATLREMGIGHYSELNPQALKTLARDGSGATAAAVLTMNLAIKPTIMDALAIIAQLATSTLEAQKAFEEYGETGTTSHFGERDVSHDLVRGADNFYVFAHGWKTEVKRTATMRSKYKYVPRSLTQALVKYWGLAGTAEALWNMLPLGFVLDYVFTVAKSLHMMARDNNVLNLTTEYCESLKVTSDDGLYICQDPAVQRLVYNGAYMPPCTRLKPLLVSGTSCTRYQRWVKEPYKGPALPKFKLPSVSQAENLLALVRCFF